MIMWVIKAQYELLYFPQLILKPSFEKKGNSLYRIHTLCLKRQKQDNIYPKSV